MNNYLIISSDKIVIDTKINDIVKKIKDKEKEIIKMDLTINTIDDVLEELNTYNFLSDVKVLVLYNASFIEGDTSFDKDLKRIDKYLDNPTDNIFIMIASKKSTKKAIEDIIKKLNVLEEEISIEMLIKNNLDNFKMDNRTMKYLIDTCHNNNEKIINELNKLKLNKMDDPEKLITNSDIDTIVIKEYDDNVFDLVNAITNRNKSKAIELYLRLKDKEDITSLVGAIASKIRILYSVKVMRDKKYTMDEMAEVLNVRKPAVSFSLDTCDNYSYQRLLSLLKELSDIDIKSKTGTKNIDLQFKMFLMNI